MIFFSEQGIGLINSAQLTEKWIANIKTTNWSVHKVRIYLSVVEPGVSRRVCQSIIWHNVCQKLYENDINYTGAREVFLAPSGSANACHNCVVYFYVKFPVLCYLSMKKGDTSSASEAVVEQLIHPIHPLVANQITWVSWKPSGKLTYCNRPSKANLTLSFIFKI